MNSTFRNFSRRNFLQKTGAVISAGALLSLDALTASPENKVRTSPGSMILRFRPYELQLKHVFTLATSSRTTTPVVLTELEYEGLVGYGEASMPPYLGESHQTVLDFLSKVDLSSFKDPFLTEDILEYVDQIAPGNHAAKAAVDIALHDLIGKMLKKPWYKLWGFNPQHTPNTSFTIGMDKPEVIRQKVAEAGVYKLLKVKLGRDNDKEIIQTIRSFTDKPLCVDVNQGWKDRQQALDMIFWLKEMGVVFVEQPMPKTVRDDMVWLTRQSPLPIMADEAVQTVVDMKALDGLYSGVNIKLMKCGGMRAARSMVEMAKNMGMKVMIGCMTETSCAVSAAAQLSPEADWADLDGNLLISNDVYTGMTIADGKIMLSDLPGIGVKPVHP